MKSTDTNINHRRVPNLATFFVWSDSVRLRKGRQGWVVTDVMRGDSPNSSERESVIGMLRKYINVDCPRK